MCQILYESKEALNVIIITWFSPLAYSQHLIGIGMNAFVIDNMSKAVHPWRVQVYLLGAKVEVCFMQLVEHLCQVFLMFFDQIGEYEYII
jgi:hypothetical protein